MANVLQIRSTVDEMGRWKEAAYRERLSLTAWVRRQLNGAAAVLNQDNLKSGGPERDKEPVGETAGEGPKRVPVPARLAAGLKKASELEAPPARGLGEGGKLVAGAEHKPGISYEKPGISYDRGSGFDQRGR